MKATTSIEKTTVTQQTTAPASNKGQGVVVQRKCPPDCSGKMTVGKVLSY